MSSPDRAVGREQAQRTRATVLDLAAARRWAVTARALLAQARDRIDALNVFPVPDGDTGTNLFLTVDGSLDFVRSQHEVSGAPLRLEQGLGLLARGMLLSARGNSGVILSQLARGMSEAVEQGGSGPDEVGPAALADAFERAADLAWAGVSRPVEGTILSVATAAAVGAREAVLPGATAYDVSLAALEAARSALAQTTAQLPRLAAAGVVDAGGAGLVLVIEALENVLSGRPHEGMPALAQWWEQHAPSGGSSAQAPSPGRPCDSPGGEGDGDYEVMYLLEQSDPERAHHLRAQLVRTGSSVLVVGGPTQWRIHVHLDEPAAAVEAGSLAGRVEQVRISALTPRGQESDEGTGERSGSTPQPQPRSTSTSARAASLAALGVVACAPGDGVAAVLSRAGAEVVHSSAHRRASTGQLLGAVRAVPARRVVVLPNDPDTILAAEAAAQAAADEGIHVRVLPTRAVVQGLAAVAVCDVTADVEETLVTMADAASAVSYGALTVAGNDATTPAGPCRKGQWLGLVGGEIVGVHDRLRDAGKQVLGALATGVAGEPELLTVVAGKGVDPTGLDTVVARWSRRRGDVEVQTIDGGQPAYSWLLGLE